tara:strand:- start:332 stop:751 length:420 start_codon:yes stop_codon:yes gene_type:complete
MHRKYIKVEGIEGVLVAVSSGARAYVAQERLPDELDDKQQIKPRAEHAHRFRPVTACVLYHRSYAKAVRKGMLIQHGQAVAATSTDEAEAMLANAKPGKQKREAPSKPQASTSRPSSSSSKAKQTKPQQDKPQQNRGEK